MPKVKDLEFKAERIWEADILYAANLETGERITVLDRMTGFGNGQRDIETGYRDTNRNFCLASGMFDIREYPELEINEAIEMIKRNSNNIK